MTSSLSDGSVTSPAPVRQASSPERATRRDRIDERVMFESVGLPAILFTSTLAASVRIAADGQLSYAPAPLMALVLGLLMVGLIVQCGVVHLPRLVGPSRTSLANACGVAVLAWLLIAAAHVVALVTPERGIFSVVVGTYLLLLLLSTLAAQPTPERVLRSLAVTLGGTLILKFVILSGLAAPGGSLAKRLLTSALEGVTLGALGAVYQTRAAGYLAFVAVLLFLCALATLPRRHRPQSR